jgi:hypothetical protein
MKLTDLFYVFYSEFQLNKSSNQFQKMKKLLFLAAFALVSFISNAQHDMSKDAAKMPSPPAKTTANIGGTTLTINYNQPAVKGRNVWAGDLAPYGKVWRTGANGAPTFEVSKDVMVNGKALKAGKYALFSIPGEKEWTIILNKNFKQWGSYDYKESDDVLRVTAKSESNDMTERFTIKAEDSGKVMMMWDKVKVAFTVK